MGDCLQVGKTSWYVTATEVDSAFYCLRNASWLAWSKGRLPSGAVLCLLRHPSELLQWLCHDNSTINIVIGIITIIIITKFPDVGCVVLESIVLRHLTVCTQFAQFS